MGVETADIDTRARGTSEANAAAFAPRADDVFARIATRYDSLCDLFSVGAHRLWKEHLARRIAELPGREVLDLATGTGDIPARVLRRLPAGHGRTLRVTDLCPQMLDMARAKLRGAPAGVSLDLADAEGLSDFADASMDIVSIAFAMKICDRRRVAAEAFRVLRPGGRFLVLEAARIPWAPLHTTYLAYMDLCLPLIARLATGGDRGAYDYLLKGVHTFPSQGAFAAELAAIGFREVSWRDLTLGIVALHEARKPG
ncbi:MAG: ubiquinone/menaquinone biosynthesis methyltransferase [Proteobacteria bacterium]|nr:ubiquinone/menaquinone biosynthesis methyltransferase [Pseudomonadota bacterium]